MTRYALVVGIAQYDSLGSLTKPTKDAEVVATVLEQHGDFQEVLRLPKRWNGEKNCYEVAAKPLKGTELGQALQEFLLDRADRKEALIYFSGHGFTVSDNLRRKKGYLATSDCTAATIATCGIPLDSLNQLILESNLSSLVVLLDSCHAGSLLESNLVRQSLTAFNSSHKDYYLIAACRDFESAWEGEQHSVFTEALLKGLREDNKGSDGKVSCDRVFAAIDEELKRSGQEPIRMGWGRSITLVQYPPKQTAVVVDETCPYQGLQPFGKEQARFFFGREKVVQLLVDKLGQANFVPIIGASGSGKSSVVRAGLIPRLEKNGWRVLEPILPGDEPLAELKTVLIELFGRTEGREVYSLIKTNGLRPLIERLSSSERLLLVVDQFEEVFTLCPKEEERRRFIELLAQVTEIPSSRLAIVTTMRADFMEDWLRYPLLNQLIQRNQAIFMPSLVGAELEEAIASPANIQGYQLETGLLGAILQDVGQEKECLPLLQFALTELWEKRNQKQHQLTVEQYLALEGVSGALNRHAEKIYIYKDFLKEPPQQERSPQEQEWIKWIFLKLVRTGEGVKDTRQRQPKAKLLAIAKNKSADEEAIAKVLDELIQEGRLLVAGQEKQQKEAWVDLAHEALMEGWERFAQWRQETRELRRLSDRVEDALWEWQKNPKNENLLMGGLLAQVREKWQELEPDLDAAAREFYQRSDADDKSRARILTLHRLLSQAAKIENLLPVQPLDGLVLAIQLMGENLEKMPKQLLKPVQTNLQRAIEADRELFVFQGHEHTVYSVAFSPDGRMIVSGSGDGTLRLWDIQGNLIGQPFRRYESLVTSVAFRPGGKMIVSGGTDGSMRLWDIQGNPIGKPCWGHEKGVNSVAFSPNEQMIVSGGADGTLRLWDIQGNPTGQPFQGHEDEVYSVAFSPGGQKIVSGSLDGTVRLWDIQGNPIGQPFHNHESPVWSVAFSPDGRMIVTGSSDNTVRLWDIQGNSIGQPFQGHEDAVTSVAFSPDGRMIVTGSSDNTVRLWDIQGNPIGQPFQGHEYAVNSVAFSPNGQMIVSGSDDKTIRLWLVGWQAWLKAACDRLRYHPVFKNPQTEVEKQACEVCQKYVWSRNE